MRQEDMIKEGMLQKNVCDQCGDYRNKMPQEDIRKEDMGVKKKCEHCNERNNYRNIS